MSILQCPDAEVDAQICDVIRDDILIADSTVFETANVLSVFPKGTILPAVEHITFPMSSESQLFQFFVFRGPSASSEPQKLGDIRVVADRSATENENGSDLTVRFSASCPDRIGASIDISLVLGSELAATRFLGSVPLSIE